MQALGQRVTKASEFCLWHSKWTLGKLVSVYLAATGGADDPHSKIRNRFAGEQAVEVVLITDACDRLLEFAQELPSIFAHTDVCAPSDNSSESTPRFGVPARCNQTTALTISRATYDCAGAAD